MLASIKEDLLQYDRGNLGGHCLPAAIGEREAYERVGGMNVTEAQD